ncbi:MAG: YdcF family protein [Acidobacteria bacterium]|nr:YdcF family protein [Acidobacteriota bacterium]
MKILIKNRITKYLIISILLLVSWFTLHSIITTIDGLSDEVKQVDIAVVFGNTIERTGLPSNRLRGRLDKAIELYKQKLFTKIVVSGGFGKEGFWEAEVMRDYLVKNQVSINDIIIDNYGNNTYLTTKNTKEIMQKNNFNSVIIITQYHHISRAKLAFWKLGIKNVYSAHANYFELRDIYSIFREFLGFYGYLINSRF